MKRTVPVARRKAPPRTRTPPPVYPFTRIVGQEEMKLALLLNVIDSSIGGVLIMGHRGTAKSTAVRGLADLLPKIERVRDCPYGCDPLDETNLCDACYARFSSGETLLRERVPVPVAELPLGATEDRVCGTVSIERALKDGVKAFEPGLLARANRGFLYIDEVNLLEDHLIDLLLDVAVTGRNVVEREGISMEHPARFRLVGSGNPEEGELRPQLVDRFGLHVEVKTPTGLDERIRIIEQREAFDRDPARFLAQAEREQGSLRRRLVRARKRLHQIELSRELLRHIAELCQQLKVEGHRGELTITRAASALAALEGRKSVVATDVRRVAPMALRHRLRRDPLQQTESSARIEQQLDTLFPQTPDGKESGGTSNRQDEDEPQPSSPSGRSGGNGAGGRSKSDRSAEGGGHDQPGHDAPPALDAQFSEASLDPLQGAPRPQATKSRYGRRRAKTRPRSDSVRRGRYVRAVSTKSAGAKIALDATVRATAGRGDRDSRMVAGENQIANAQPPSAIPFESLRYKRFSQKAGTLFIFAIDTSGSMALNRIAQAKGAMTRLLQQSYLKRDRVALVSFRGHGADLMLRPTGSTARAKRTLDALAIGGATPLAAGLMSALEIALHVRRQSAERIVLLLFTDGRANVSLRTREGVFGDALRREIENELARVGTALVRASVTTIVVDTQNRFTSGGEGKRLADLIAGRYVYLSSVPSAGELFTSLVRQARY